MTPFLDYYNYTLKEIKAIFQNSKILPSRLILKENIEKNFDKFESFGIKDIKDVLRALKNKVTILEFSQKSGLSVEYLTIFLRQIKSFIPKSISLKKLYLVNNYPDYLDYYTKLESIGIKNTFYLLEASETKQARKALAEKTKIPIDKISDLVRLSDLYRIGAIKAVRARMYLEAGFTPQKIANSTPEKLFEQFNNISMNSDYVKIDPPIGDLTGNINEARRHIQRFKVEY